MGWVGTYVFKDPTIPSQPYPCPCLIWGLSVNELGAWFQKSRHAWYAFGQSGGNFLCQCLFDLVMTIQMNIFFTVWVSEGFGQSLDFWVILDAQRWKVRKTLKSIN